MNPHVRPSTFAAFVLVALLGGGATAHAADPPADRDAIQGNWRVVGANHEGQEMPKAEFEKIPVVLTFKGARVFERQGDQERDPAGFTVDATKSPKQIDLKPENGPDKGRTLPGVYALNGDDLQITIAYAPNAARPADLKAAKGRIVMTLRRVVGPLPTQPAAQAPAPAERR